MEAMNMDAKWKGPMATVMGVLAIPLAGALLYGAYFVFTFKAKPKPPEPKIVTFRADGKLKDEAKDAKKKPAAKKSDVPQVWDVELIWEVENADEITIDSGIGKVEPKSSKHVEIDKNTTFVMKAKNITGEVTYSLAVDVLPASQ
jgi:hypothetical protein